MRTGLVYLIKNLRKAAYNLAKREMDGIQNYSNSAPVEGVKSGLSLLRYDPMPFVGLAKEDRFHNALEILKNLRSLQHKGRQCTDKQIKP
jgi:hypothetical protein